MDSLALHRHSTAKSAPPAQKLTGLQARPTAQFVLQVDTHPNQAIGARRAPLGHSQTHLRNLVVTYAHYARQACTVQRLQHHVSNAKRDQPQMPGTAAQPCALLVVQEGSARSRQLRALLVSLDLSLIVAEDLFAQHACQDNTAVVQPQDVRRVHPAQ